MTGLVEAVRKNVDESCVAIRIEKDGCMISLNGAPKPRLIIDFDKPGSPLMQVQKRCDYLFVAEAPDNPGWVVPLELKSGSVDASEVVKQLQAGASTAEKLVPDKMAVKFRPVAAFRGGIHKAERNKLKSNQVRFRQCSESVRLINCDAPLTKALGA